VSASKWDTGPVRFDADHPFGVDGERRREEVDEVRRYIESTDASTLFGSEGAAPQGFALTPVAAIDDILASAQNRDRSSIVTVADDELGPVSLARAVPAFSRTPGRIRHASPRLDEHRAEIIEEWIKP
jgi:crotonobetainyl-CoA:carnitine CoA-transferase CaiB-like acyl-CoA transferase